MNVQRLKLNSSQQTFLGLTLLVLSVVTYLYFLNVSVVHVVIRKEVLKEQNQMRGEIAMLETSYIEAQHKIAGRIADLDGYSIDTAKIFVTRGEDSLVLKSN